jgi:hypothetical protein
MLKDVAYSAGLAWRKVSLLEESLREDEIIEEHLEFTVFPEQVTADHNALVASLQVNNLVAWVKTGRSASHVTLLRRRNHELCCEVWGRQTVIEMCDKGSNSEDSGYKIEQCAL